VRIAEQPRAKAVEVFALGIELQNRRIRRPATHAGGRARRYDVEAPVKDPDVSFGVQVYADDLSPFASVHRLRKRRPALNEAIGIGQLRRFGVFGLLRARHLAKNGDRRKRSHNEEFGSWVHR